jgi:hypothetical protein
MMGLSSISTYVPVLTVLVLLFVSFISAQAQIIPSLYLPYPGSPYGNGGAIQITLPYSSSPVCQVRVPVTLAQYEYTTPEFFVVFLSTTNTVSYPIWASLTMSPPIYSSNGFGNTGEFSIGYYNYGAFIQIPPIIVPSNYIDSSNHTTIYIGASNAYGTVVNASAALPHVCKLNIPSSLLLNAFQLTFSSSFSE